LGNLCPFLRNIALSIDDAPPSRLFRGKGWQCLVGCCLGLRVSEILGLQWGDVDFEQLFVTAQRAVVLGTVGKAKTKKSAARMPLDAELATVLLNYQLRTKPNPSPSDWIFSNPETNRPWRPSHIQSKYIRPAGIKVVGTAIGCHNFRHTFSTMLRANGADIKVQQELVRHADAATTLNIYTQADSELKRKPVAQVASAILDTSGQFQL
jgi:integrase